MPVRLRSSLAVLLLCVWTSSSGVETLALSAGRLALANAVIHDSRLRYELAADRLTLTAARLELPGRDAPVTQIRITCTTPSLTGSVRGCEGARATAHWPPLGTVRFRADIAYQPDAETLDITIHELPVGDGRARIAAHQGPAGWRVNVQASDLPVTRLAEIGAVLPEGWQVSGGQTSANVTVSADAAGTLRTAGKLTLHGLAGSNATGLQAGEGLTGELGWAARRDHEGWFGQADLSVSSGQLYSDPVFIDFATHPLTLSTDFLAPGDLSQVRLSGFQLEHENVASGQGQLVWQRGDGLTQLRLEPLSLQFPGAYHTYAQPFLVGTPGDGLTTSGTATLSLATDADGPRRARLSLQTVDVAADERYVLRGVSGVLDWHTEALDAPPASRLTIDDGSLYGVAIGSFRLPLQLHGDDLRLLSPTRVPILDGALELATLSLSDLASDSPSGTLDARIAPIDLGRLTEALGWPAFAGTLSGRLPTLRYAEGTASLGGELQLSAFEGDIRLRNLMLADPLGTLPRLRADISVNGLDLESLTSAFEFGRITGTLDGEIEGLRLLDWRPAAFRAWFHTPAQDPVPHRISQRAIAVLSDLGGSGAAGALSRGFLRVFENFGYRRLGLGCALRDDVCLMRGIAETDNGYYIVQGAGIPRVDVIGHARRVSWSTLIQQLQAVTRGQAPVVE